MEKRKNTNIWLMALTGFFIGIAAIAPGISGGAIAIIFGLYQPITDAIAHIWKDFRQKAKFLLPLAVGAAAGMLLFSRIINFLFLNYHDMVCALFVGLIAGTLPSVFRTASEKGFRVRYLLATAVCAVLVAWLTAMEGLQYRGSSDELPYWLAIVCGGVVGLGSVLPGMSASFFLMSMGVYESMLRALNEFDVLRMLLLGVGFVAVVLLTTRAVSWLYKKAYGWMSFAAAGLLIGSVFNVVPVPKADASGMLLVVLAAGGATLTYFLLRLKK